MQQRVGLVRALAIDPDILLMDEPFAALDAQTREVLQEELLRIMQDERKTMVFITHSIDEAILLGDRIAVMSARPGRIKEILDVPLARPRDGNALRADPRFAELRAHIWNELRAPAGRGGVMAVQAGHIALDDAGPSAPARAKSPRRASAAAPGRCSAIRIVSVIVVLALWQYVGSGIDPVLFTTPSAVARAAYDMLAQRRIVDLSLAEPRHLRGRARPSRRWSASRPGSCSRASG